MIIFAKINVFAKTLVKAQLLIPIRRFALWFFSAWQSQVMHGSDATKEKKNIFLNIFWSWFPKKTSLPSITWLYQALKNRRSNRRAGYLDFCSSKIKKKKFVLFINVIEHSRRVFAKIFIFVKMVIDRKKS